MKSSKKTLVVTALALAGATSVCASERPVSSPTLIDSSLIFDAPESEGSAQALAPLSAEEMKSTVAAAVRDNNPSLTASKKVAAAGPGGATWANRPSSLQPKKMNFNAQQTTSRKDELGGTTLTTNHGTFYFKPPPQPEPDRGGGERGGRGWTQQAQAPVSQGGSQTVAPRPVTPPAAPTQTLVDAWAEFSDKCFGYYPGQFGWAWDPTRIRYVDTNALVLGVVTVAALGAVAAPVVSRGVNAGALRILSALETPKGGAANTAFEKWGSGTVRSTLEYAQKYYQNKYGG